MPEHGHGFPTVPEVTEYLGDGKYLVEGLKFSMPGWWVGQFPHHGQRHHGQRQFQCDRGIAADLVSVISNPVVSRNECAVIARTLRGFRE